MLRRTEPNTLKRKRLTISRSDYERILMWSQSQKEILFICLGTKNSIKKVVRLCNTSRDPKNYSFWNDFAFNWSVNRQAIAYEKILAYGHSHPSKRHDPHPSKIDIKYSKKDSIEMIAFPFYGNIRAWKIKSSIKETLNNEISIEIT